MTQVLTAIALSCAMLAGCAETGGNPNAKERGARGASDTTTEPPAGETTMTDGTEVGEAFAEATLRPVGDSGVGGDAVFKEVGSLGVQVELAVSGLPAPGEPYFAQVHGGSCSEAPRGGAREPEDDHVDDHHGHDHEHGGGGGGDPALALVRLDRFLVVAPEYADHGEYEYPPADELPGNIDTPVSVAASADGTGAVTSLLDSILCAYSCRRCVGERAFSLTRPSVGLKFSQSLSSSSSPYTPTSDVTTARPLPVETRWCYPIACRAIRMLVVP